MAADREGDGMRRVHLVWGQDAEGRDLGLMRACGSSAAADAAIAELRREDGLASAVEATTERVAARFMEADPRPAKLDVPVPEAAPSQAAGEPRSDFRARTKAWKQRRRETDTAASAPLLAWSGRWRAALDAALLEAHGTTSAGAATGPGRPGASYHVTTMPIEEIGPGGAS